MQMHWGLNPTLRNSMGPHLGAPTVQLDSCGSPSGCTHAQQVNGSPSGCTQRKKKEIFCCALHLGSTQGSNPWRSSSPASTQQAQSKHTSLQIERQPTLAARCTWAAHKVQILDAAFSINSLPVVNVVMLN